MSILDLLLFKDDNKFKFTDIVRLLPWTGRCKEHTAVQERCTTLDLTRLELPLSRVMISWRNLDTTVRNPTSGLRLETALLTRDSRRPSRLDSKSGGTSEDLSSGALPEPWSIPSCPLSSLRMSSLPLDSGNTPSGRSENYSFS